MEEEKEVILEEEGRAEAEKATISAMVLAVLARDGG